MSVCRAMPTTIETFTEMDRARARAKLCKSRVSREPMAGHTDRFAVRVDGQHVGYLYRADAAASWGAVYDGASARHDLGAVHGKGCALDELKTCVMREEERRIAAELDVAVAIARDLMPNGIGSALASGRSAPGCSRARCRGEPAHAVIAEGTVSNTRASVADPRLVRPQRSDAYGVNSAAEPSGTIVGHHQHDNVAGSVADARVAVELDHTPRRGSMGVQDSGEPSDVVRGNHSIRQAPGAVDDARVAQRDLKPGKARRAAKPKKPAKPSLPCLYNERGWPVATHYLVQLDDGRLVLYGPAVDFSDPRPRADIVIVALDGTRHRPFTDEELALLMGFPLGFTFCGPSSCSRTKPGAPLKTGRRKRIGNAVPPPTAYAIAQECMATLVASANGGFRLASGDVWVSPETGAIAA